MTDDERISLARANAQALGLALTEEQVKAVAAQLAILFEHAGNFSTIDLDDHIEPLTEYYP